MIAVLVDLGTELELKGLENLRGVLEEEAFQPRGAHAVGG